MLASCCPKGEFYSEICVRFFVKFAEVTCFASSLTTASIGIKKSMF